MPNYSSHSLLDLSEIFPRLNLLIHAEEPYFSPLFTDTKTVISNMLCSRTQSDIFPDLSMYLT